MGTGRISRGAIATRIARAGGPRDSLPPRLVSASYAAGGTLTLTFSEDVIGSFTGGIQFSNVTAGTNQTRGPVSTGTGKVWTVATTLTVNSGDTLTTSDNGAGITDRAGNPLAAFSSFPITNTA